MIVCKLTNVNKYYSKKSVFENLNLVINSGDFVCIKGGSGSGKSTLFNVIGGLDSIDSGSIQLFGNDNIKNNSKILRTLLKNKIGFIFQNYGLIDDRTVLYNLNIINKHKKSILEYEDLLKQLDLNVSLNQKVHTLSGGEQQRVALAKIILKDCDLILADEPTASLDTKNSQMVMKTLKYLNEQGKTIILVTHDNSVAQTCQTIYELEHGFIKVE